MTPWIVLVELAGSPPDDEVFSIVKDMGLPTNAVTKHGETFYVVMREFKEMPLCYTLTMEGKKGVRGYFHGTDCVLSKGVGGHLKNPLTGQPRMTDEPCLRKFSETREVPLHAPLGFSHRKVIELF